MRGMLFFEDCLIFDMVGFKYAFMSRTKNRNSGRNRKQKKNPQMIGWQETGSQLWEGLESRVSAKGGKHWKQPRAVSLFPFKQEV